jgi:hypothetical protein
MPKWTRWMFVLAVVGAVAVAGCGGDSYPDNADKICKEAAEKAKGITKPKAVGDLHVYFLRSQMVLAEEIRKLKAIEAPSDKRPAYMSFVSRLDGVLRVLRRATNTVADNPRRALTLIAQQGGSARTLRNQQARVAGLKECAKAG